jgi:hypothetical protein
MKNFLAVLIFVFSFGMSKAQGNPDLPEAGPSKGNASNACELQGQYEEKVAVLDTKRIRFNELYASDPEMNEEEADILARKWLQNDVATEKLKRKYYRKLKKATSSTLSSKYLLYDSTALEGCP